MLLLRVVAFLIPTVSFLPRASAFYIPGISPHAYKDNDVVPLYTNKLTSDVSQLTYAYDELPFVCGLQDSTSKFHPSKRITLNIGQLLRGDRITPSDYKLEVGKDVKCQELCTAKVTQNDLRWAKGLIEDEYMVEWIVDNLPGGTSYKSPEGLGAILFPWFRLGEYNDKKEFFLNTHHIIVLRWRKSRDDPKRKHIVGFEVYTGTGTKEDCQSQPYKIPDIKPDDSANIKYTYSVYWKEENNVEWASRWDQYYIHKGDSDKIHWLATVNCAVVAMVLTGTVAIIMLRTLSRDIQKYNQDGMGEEGRRLRLSRMTSEGDEVEEDDILEDVTGWKLVHGDVFRPPTYAWLFAPLVGSGAQLLVVCVGLLTLSVVGVLNPSYRGGFMTVAVFLFMFAGIFSGYFSTRIHLLLQQYAPAATSPDPSSTKPTSTQPTWLYNALITSLLLPSFLFLVILLPLNFVLWSKSSSMALPFGNLLSLLALWLFISLPLVLTGAILAKRKHNRTPPTIPGRVNVIPRQIPRKAWYLRTVPSALIAGLVPFATIFIELLFLLETLRTESRTYVMYGFLFLIFALWAIVTTETGVIVTYFVLCAEEYRWWWRAFLSGAGSAAWIMLYACWWYRQYLGKTGAVSLLVWGVYVVVSGVGIGIVGGAIAWVGSWWFVRRIYGAIKAD